jgi:regulator of protease activity HflC (stomatin/prohibitin superfamily)
MDKRLIRLFTLIGGAVIVLLIFSSSLFVTIGSGELGVKYQPLAGGLDTDDVYSQGLKFKMPWNSMIIFEVRKQENEQSMEVLSSNGLDIQVDVSVRYRPDPEKIGYLYNEVGKNYLNKIIIPELRSATREVIGQYKPEELYSSDRQKIQNKIFTRTKEVLSKNFINLDAILIRSIQLPTQIKNAIEQKLTEQQKIQQKEYSKKVAKKEAEREKIEARGKADANEILSKSLTDEILKEKAITATEKLVQSDNSKVIVVGNGQDGLPIMLSADKQQ